MSERRKIGHVLKLPVQLRPRLQRADLPTKHPRVRRLRACFALPFIRKCVFYVKGTRPLPREVLQQQCGRSSRWLVRK